MSEMRIRGKQRRALRSPFLLAVLAVLLGAVGFTQWNTPLNQIAVFATFTPTSTPPSTPTQTRTTTSTVTPTSTPPATNTATATSSLTATPHVTQTVTATETLLVSLTPLGTGTFAAAQVPGNTPTPVARETRVPILMYHHVGDLPRDADAVRKSLTVSPVEFEAQIKYLAEQGYTTIHLTALMDYLQMGAPLPEKSVVLTFDDGYDDNYTNVFPTLKDYGFVGTFFIIGAPTDYGSPGYLRWEQILEMYDNGMEIGAHSLTHRYNLGQMRPSTQDGEIKNDHKLMVDHLPNWTPIFSYPSGSYNAYTIELLRQLGYIAAVTTNQGTLQASQDPFELRRIRIRGEWSTAQFIYWFNYWVGTGQQAQAK